MNRKYYKSDNRKAFYASRVKQQNGRCAICKSKERLVIDHDHASGFMRGLLCYKHNTALGMFRDDPALLRAAATYLETTQPEIFNEIRQITKTYSSYEQSRRLLPALLDDVSFSSDRARARLLSELTGCSVATAQTRVHRARKKSLTIQPESGKVSNS